MLIRVGSDDNFYTWAIEWPPCDEQDFKDILRLACHHERIPESANRLAREMLCAIENRDKTTSVTS